MKPDISNPADIQFVVTSFYEKVASDEHIGFFFSEVVPVDWGKHLPQMCAFWENVLFYTGEYEGDPITTHRKVHQKFPTQQLHFKRWIELFDQSIDELFAGPNAEKMKAHSRAIANVMIQKMEP